MQKKSKSFETKILVRAGLLVALSIILTRFFSIMPTPQLRIGFGQIPILLSGFLYGPVVGACVGAIADIVGVSLMPQGTIHLGFTLSSMLTGLIPGLIRNYIIDKKNTKLLLHLSIGCVLVTLICHIGLNTLWLTQLFGKGFLTLLPARALKSFIELVINIFIIRILYVALKDR